MGAYRVFFNQPFLLEHPFDGAVGRQGVTGFGQLPFDGGWADLSVLLRLKVKPGLDDSLTIGFADGFGPFEWRSGLILIPVRLPALVALEPFKKPVLGAVKITVNVFG